MVSNKDIIQLMEAPHLIGVSQIAELKELQKQYPYCNLLDLLITKGYHNHQLIGYNQILKETAISIPNREVLYHLIYKKAVQSHLEVEKATEVVEIKTEAEDTQTLNLSKEEKVNNEKVTEETQPSLAGRQDHNSVEEKESVEDSLKANQDQLNQQNSEEKVIEDTRASLADRQDQNSISHEKETLTFSQQTDEETQKLEELILASALSSSYLLNESVENKEKETTETNKEVEQEETHQDRSFYGWLNPKKKIQTTKSTPNKSIDELVDNFIKNKESEKIERKEFFSPTNMAKISLVEDESFVTETLAKIYLQQKKYDKAIDAYEKLILKNPEKKPYFAIQIKKIKDLLN